MKREIYFIGSSLKDFKNLPFPVQETFTFALRRAQEGKKHPIAKPMKGFGGAGIIELAMDFERDTYRAIYTVNFRDRIYVLHVFKKKSKHGIKTSKTDIDMIRRRLRFAQQHYEQESKETL